MTGLTEAVVTYAILSSLVASYVYSRISLHRRLQNEVSKPLIENTKKI